jgi:hypothetical protein
MTNKDAFDLWWEWADKPVDNKPTIDAAIYDAVMALPPDERRDREKVNAAVRDGLALGPERLPAQRTSTTFRRRRNFRLGSIALVHRLRLDVGRGGEPILIRAILTIRQPMRGASVERVAMCDKCDEPDKKIDQYRRILLSIGDQITVDGLPG